MALPELLPPAGLPPFLIDGHQFAPDSLFANQKRGSGSQRKRRLWTESTKVARVAWVFTSQDQMLAVHRWYSRSLRGGELRFAAQILGIDGEPAWYEAEWMSPMDEDPLHLHRWRVTGVLLLHGLPYADPPTLSGFEAEVDIPLIMRGTLLVQPLFEAEVDIPLEPSTRFRAEVAIDLLPG
jgi:hypothetical protein